MLFNKILVAFDGSDASEDALEKAIALLRANHKAELEVLHVIQLPNLVVGEAIITVPVGVRNDYYAAAEEVVAEAKARLDLLPEKPKVTMLTGRAAERIILYAEEGGFDLIVIGSRGLGGIREFFLGSVSHNVVQHARIPVLVVK